MITTKQREKSYRVAQREACMRTARKVSVRNLRDDYSVLSLNYPKKSKCIGKTLSEVAVVGVPLFVAWKKSEAMVAGLSERGRNNE